MGNAVLRYVNDISLVKYSDNASFTNKQKRRAQSKKHIKLSNSLI